ncbi:MAG TPA: hypothetical protein VFK13_02635 [Gemmatimonadaceae bacterium]|nr:hypothetical protein [Gemmatimonadaceae bacterium]
MSWKRFIRLTAVIAVFDLVVTSLDNRAQDIVLVGVLVVCAAIAPVVRWRWRRRLKALRALPPDEAARAVDELPEWERAAARIALDLVTSAEATAPPEGCTFSYGRTPKALREGTFWFSAAVPIIALVVIMINPGIQDRWYLVAMAVFFTVSVGVQLRSWDREGETIQVTSSGLRAVSGDGVVTGMLWSEVAAIRNRRLLGRVEIHAVDGRRCIRVRYTLVDFTRFMELVVAHLKDAGERAAAYRR